MSVPKIRGTSLPKMEKRWQGLAGTRTIQVRVDETMRDVTCRVFFFEPPHFVCHSPGLCPNLSSTLYYFASLFF